MKVDILTLFPEMIKPFLENSIIQRATEKNIAEINYINIREFSKDKHKKVDDYPFGGSEGLLMACQPIDDAFKSIKGEPLKIYLSPKGRKVNQNIIEFLSAQPHVAYLCGHYEGVDQRIIDKHIDLELSLGDFVLTGGEIACSALVDASLRLVDGTLSSDEAYQNESFYKNLLEAPSYTRPREYEGQEVPEVLLSGNHAEIKKWQDEQAIIETKKHRPDLLASQRVGILGGSFDPIHESHIKIASLALEQNNLDKVLFIPTNKSADKTPHLPAHARATKVMQAIKDYDKFDIDMCEIRRGDVTYAIDTIKYLQQKYPAAKFYYIIGSDTKKTLHNWKDYDKVLDLIEFIVFERDEISSTKIRESWELT